jgi:hypothetical protein
MRLFSHECHETVTGMTTENLFTYILQFSKTLETRLGQLWCAEFPNLRTDDGCTCHLSDFRFLTHLRKALRKEPRMLSSLHAHVACMGLGVRRPKVWDRL